MVADAELEAEQSYITRAHRLLDAARAKLGELRKLVDTTGGGTRQAVFDRDVVEATIADQLALTELGSASLVFGRLDYSTREATSGAQAVFAGETFYVGRIAVSDERHEPVVVDWRADVARPFFAATPSEPMGLLRRRHFTTAGERLQGIEDEVFELDRIDQLVAEPTVGEPAAEVSGSAQGETDGGATAPEAVVTAADGRPLRARGALMAALTSRRSGRMGDAVATIQSEQDEVIRSPLEGVLVVQGGPGTGKTVVALHRAAYLLYAHGWMLEGQGVLVVGPNRLFLYYIERVLPSLGASGVRISVVADLWAELFPSTRVRLADDRPTAALKGSARMVRVLRRAVADRQRPLRQPLRLPFAAGYVTLSVAASRRIVTDARHRFSRHNSAHRWVVGQVFAELARSARVEVDPNELRQQLSGHPELLRELDRMWPELSPLELLRDLFGSEALLRSASRGTLSNAEQQLLSRPRGEPDDYEFSTADVPLLDEAFTLLGRRRSHRTNRNFRDPEVRTYGHIVVDEAQDTSPMALRMLARRSLHGSMTVVGDVAQATDAAVRPSEADDGGAGASNGQQPPGRVSWDDVVRWLRSASDDSLLPAESTARARHDSAAQARADDSRRAEPPRQPLSKDPAVTQRELTLCYRIPAPMLGVAADVLRAAEPSLTPPLAVREDGDPPRFISARPADQLASSVAAAAADLARLDQTVLVVAPARHIAAVDTALARSGVDYGLANDTSLEGIASLRHDVTLVPVQLVRGLEADAVVVVEPADIVSDEPRGLNALYVAVTRATRHLTVIAAQPLPEALRRSTTELANEPATEPNATPTGAARHNSAHR